MNQDIQLVRGGRYLPPQTAEFLADIGLSVYVSQIRFICQSDKAATMLGSDTNPFWNFYHEALTAAVREHPIARRRQA